MAYIGSSPTKVVSRQSANIFTYTATANQTAFTGTDANGNTLACTPSDIMVHMNGLRLEESDYTASTTTVTLGSGAAAGDEVTITAFVTFETADAYTKSASDARYVNTAGGTMTGDLTVDTNTFHVDVADNRVGIGTTAPTNNLTIVDGGGSAYGADATVLLDMKRNVTNSGATNAVGLRLANNSNGFEIKYGGASDTLNISGGSGNTMATFRNDGGMTLPYQPCFVATRNSNHVIGTSDAIIPIDSEDFDVGNNYNTSTYTFTAPVTGKYLFSFQGTINSINSGTYNAVYMHKNGSGTGYRFRTLSGSGWTGINGSCIISLAVNDYVSMYGYTHSGSMTLQGAEIHFMGYLIG